MMRTEITPVETVAAAAPEGHRGPRLKVMLVTVGLGVGGTETQILEMASRLDRSRFDVLVCGLKKGGVVAAELRARGVRVSTLDGLGKGDLRVLYRLARLISAERPDIVHAFIGLANLAALLTGRLLGVPAIIWSYRDVEVWKTKVHWLMDRAGARWADAVTCCSDAVRRFVQERMNGEARKFSTIHNGVDLDTFAAARAASRSDLALREGGVIIGTVCRLDEPKKGLAVLLHALSRLSVRSGIPAWQLLLVGDGPARDSLRRLAGQLGLLDRVMFAGMRRDVAPVLSAMDVFVCPSLYEGFGIAIVEAMAAGRPVVASSVGGIPEIVVPGVTGLLVPPGEAAALADAMETLLAHPERARAMGQRGRERARERFSIETAVRRHEQLYESFGTGRAGRARLARGAEVHRA